MDRDTAIEKGGDIMACRTRIFLTDMDAFNEALMSGDFPTEGLDGFLDVNAAARTVTIRGSVSAVGNVWRFLSKRKVIDCIDRPSGGSQ